VAVINLPPPATPVVLVGATWFPLVGSDEVTVGIVGPAAALHATPGMIAPAGAPGMPARTLPPRTGSFPPHPAAKATSSNAMDPIKGLVTLSNLFILLPFFI
jgi:hypothetical protein